MYAVSVIKFFQFQFQFQRFGVMRVICVAGLPLAPTLERGLCGVSNKILSVSVSVSVKLLWSISITRHSGGTAALPLGSTFHHDSGHSDHSPHVTSVSRVTRHSVCRHHVTSESLALRLSAIVSAMIVVLHWSYRQ